MKNDETKDSQRLSDLFSDEDARVMQGLMNKVLAEGFVPKAKLVEEFGDTATTKALAHLHKLHRALVESREAWEGSEVNGFKLAERRFSQPEIKKLPPALAFLPELFKSRANKYGDFKSITVRCRYITDVLGAIPIKTEPTKFSDDGKALDGGEAVCAFERYWNKTDVIIQRFGIRAMFGKALELFGRSRYAADRFGFETIVLHNPKLSYKVRGVTDDMGKGLGTIKSECVSAGTEFILRAMVPTTYLSPNDYLAVLRIGGSMVGLSPGRSAGYGNFEVLSVEPS